MECAQLPQEKKIMFTSSMLQCWETVYYISTVLVVVVVVLFFTGKLASILEMLYLYNIQMIVY